MLAEINSNGWLIIIGILLIIGPFATLYVKRESLRKKRKELEKRKNQDDDALLNKVEKNSKVAFRNNPAHQY